MGLMPVRRRSFHGDLRASVGLLRVRALAYPASFLRGSTRPRPNGVFDLRVCPHPFVGSANDLCHRVCRSYESVRHGAAVVSWCPANLRTARAAAAQPLRPFLLASQVPTYLARPGTKALEAGISVLSA